MIQQQYNFQTKKMSKLSSKELVNLGVETKKDKKEKGDQQEQEDESSEDEKEQVETKITKQEIKKLGKYVSLYKNWGYRTGKEGAHEKYEAIIQYDIALQEYTDIVFRNLEQIAIEGKTRWYDVGKKLKSAQDIVLQDAYKTDKARLHITSILMKFVSETDNLEKLTALSKEDIDDSSETFYGIVLAAQAILELCTDSKSGFKKAHKIMKTAWEQVIEDGNDKV